MAGQDEHMIERLFGIYGTMKKRMPTDVAMASYNPS